MSGVDFAADPRLHAKALSRGTAIQVHIDFPEGMAIERMSARATPISSARSRRRARGTDGGVRIEGLGEGIVRLDVYVWMHTQALSFKTQFHTDVSVDGTSDIEHRFEVK